MQRAEGKPSKLRFYKDYLVCITLGSGAQGDVQLIYQPEYKKAAVLKYFRNSSSYQLERNVYLDINHKDKNNKTVFKLIQSDDNNNILVMERGDCDLQNFIQLRVQNN